MSEFLAEAQILIQANTVAFRTELAAALAAVPKVIPIEIVATSSVGTVSSSVKQAKTELAAASSVAAAGLDDETIAARNAGSELKKQQVAEKKLTDEARKAARVRGEVTKGLQAQALSAAGLRGAIIGANTAFLAATAGAILFGKSIQSAVQFQTELATFAATTGASAGQIQQVSEAAKQLGADLTLPGVNAQDAAVAMTELSKAGLSVQDSIAGARGVLQLATAAQIDNAAATELAASALNAFGLSGEDAVHVADVLANSANDAQGSITDIGIALQQASAAGRQAGLSLEATVGILTEFARAGIKGSDAGTLLRTLLIRLINPTNKAQEVIDKLGLHLRDATGNINLAFFDEFARKTRNLTKAERDRDAAIIAGQDAFRGLTILARTGGTALDEQITRLDKSGTAAELAAARTSGLAGAAENLKNQLSTAGLAIGQTLIPGLTNLTNAASTTITTASDLVQQIGKLREESTKPIEFVIDLIPGGGGGGGGGFADRVKGFIDDFVSTLPGQVAAAGENFTHLQQIIRESNAEFEAVRARKALPGIIEDLNKAKANPVAFNDTILKLKDLESQMTGGAPATEAFRKSFDAFIEHLQSVSATKITIPITLPDAVLRGTFGQKEARDAGKTSAEQFGAAFIPSVGDAFKVGGEQGWQAFKDAAARNAREAAASVAAAVSSAVQGVTQGANQQAGLDDLMNKILLGGGSPQQQVAGFQKQFAVQQAVIDKAAKGLEGLTAGDKGFATLTKAVRAARAKQVQINGQIEGIQNQVKADQAARVAKAKQDAQQAQSDAAKADQAVLDSFAPGQNRIDLSAISANASKRLSDDIKLQTLIITTAQREQAIIEKTVKDAKTRNTQLAARVQTIKAARVERDRLEQEAADAATQRRQDAFQAQVDLAAAEGNIPAQLRFITIRIRAIDKLIAGGKQEGAALNRLKAERAQLRQQREDVQNQQIQDQIALGQSIEDLTGNKNPLVQALDKAIAQTRQDINAAKRAGRSTVVLQTELNNFLKQRKDVIEGAKDQAKDQTTAFDLLKEASDTFNKSAGNLINGNQPFAGPTGFTADIAQFLIRRQPAATAAAAPTVKAQVPPVQLQDQPLIQAIEKLTDAVNGAAGNASTAGGTPSAKSARQWHAENMIARKFQEA